MTKAIAALTIALIAAPTATAQEQEQATLQFMPPGAFNGKEISASGGEWLLLVFDHVDATVYVPIDRPSTVTNLTLFHPLRMREQDRGVDPAPIPTTENHSLPAGSAMELAFRSSRPSSLYIEAESIALDVTMAQGVLNEKSEQEGIYPFTRDTDRWRDLHLAPRPLGSHAVLQFQATDGQMGFQLDAQSVHAAEWYDAAASCQRTTWCPRGGGPDIQHLGEAGGQSVTSDRLSYESIRELDGLQGNGGLSYAVLGGRQLDLAIHDGMVRLPLADGTASCSQCHGPDNQTLTATGDPALLGLRRDSSGELQAELGGSLTRARFDETFVDPRLLVGLGFAGGTALVAAGAVLAVKALLGALFTKLPGDEVLSQPRRRLIYETIVANPGVGFRELTRRTELSYGVVRHHLDLLLRHDKITQRNKGANVHFFENHGKFDATWHQVSALHKDGPRLLHAWLRDHPNATQMEVIAGMSEHGWSRTATQRTLNGLAHGGLASITRQGRFKRFQAVPIGQMKTQTGLR